MSQGLAIRPATRADAADMALLVNIAGHGLPSFVWSRSEGADEVDSPFEIGRLRAMRDTGSFSWTNTDLVVSAEEVVGMHVGYRQPDEEAAVDPTGVDPIFLPLLELEAEAPATWYINVLAVFAHWRGKGAGSLLMAHAARRAAATAARGISLIAADANKDAMSFYAHHGFRVRAERPLVTYPGSPAGGSWLLMVKD
jgi:ribosomal protein S18 acetylase RimI-like enzyme